MSDLESGYVGFLEGFAYAAWFLVCYAVSYKVALPLLSYAADKLFPLFRGILTRRAPGASAIQEHKNT